MIQLYLNWTISKHAIAAGKPDSKIIFASQMWAARPHLASIFEKLLEQKTFCLPAARYLETMLLKKTVFRIRQKGFHPCFCLPACCNCPVALSEFATLIFMIQLCLNWTVSKMQLQQENKVAKSNLLRKCGLLAHTSAAFLKNCCTEKLFSCLRLVFYNQLCFIWFLIRLHHNR